MCKMILANIHLPNTLCHKERWASVSLQAAKAVLKLPSADCAVIAAELTANPAALHSDAMSCMLSTQTSCWQSPVMSSCQLC